MSTVTESCRTVPLRTHQRHFPTALGPGLLATLSRGQWAVLIFIRAGNLHAAQEHLLIRSQRATSPNSGKPGGTLRRCCLLSKCHLLPASKFQVKRPSPPDGPHQQDVSSFLTSCKRGLLNLFYTFTLINKHPVTLSLQPLGGFCTIR
jgi:hypothetical protein